MSTIAELEKMALDLSENDRALLATHILRSLPAVLHDEDDGLAEALRRDAELEADPSIGISLEEFQEKINRHRER
jgi:putative addiction module component (TIGR02574 family)